MVPHLLGNAGRFFDWLDVRKQAPDFREKFPHWSPKNERTGSRAPGSGALELPPFSLDVQRWTSAAR